LLIIETNLKYTLFIFLKSGSCCYMVKKEYEEGEIKITIDMDKCTGVGECVTSCPVDIFEVVDGKAVCKNV